ncbi:MAG: hypothetical protein R3B90_02880 [Planctomycetaceae bacterium]
MKKKSQRDSDGSMNLDADSTLELNRNVVDQTLPMDSAVIPNIESWLKGRPDTKRRELLQNDFGDTTPGG